jgi:tetratricopeptide (TPR) repeat protein
MAALVGLYGEPLEESQLGADDLAGVARTLKRAGDLEQAATVAERAASASPSEHTLKARAEIAKARGDRARALKDFEALAGHVDSEKVRLELAKLYEHYTKDFGSARAVIARGTGEDSVRAARRAQRIAEKLNKAESLPLMDRAAKGRGQ